MTDTKIFPLFTLIIAALFLAHSANCSSELSSEMSIQLQHMKTEFAEMKRQLAEMKAQNSLLKTAFEGLAHRKTKINRLKEFDEDSHHVIRMKRDSKADTRATAMPQSCGDLKSLGYTLSGIYTVVAQGSTPQKLETVFCDFNVSQLNPNFETRLGFSDVKTSSVHFSVRRNSLYNAAGTTITFDSEMWNVGGGMNASTGIFTAPCDGLYFFLFCGVSNFVEASVVLRYRSISSSIDVDLATATGSGTKFAETAVAQSAAVLKKGDSVYLYLGSGSLYDNAGRHYMTFTGFLVEEDLVLLSQN